MGELLEFQIKKPVPGAEPEKKESVPPPREPKKKEFGHLRPTRRGRMALNIAATALAGVTAWGVSANAPKAIEAGVSAITHGVDKFEQPVDNVARDATIVSYITGGGTTIDPYFREFPDPNRSGPDGKIKIDELLKNGYDLKDFVVELVYGRPYPVANIPQTGTEIERARQIASMWQLKENAQNYWNFKDKNLEYGIWGRTTLKNTQGQNRTYYASLNFLKPLNVKK